MMEWTLGEGEGGSNGERGMLVAVRMVVIAARPSTILLCPAGTKNSQALFAIHIEAQKHKILFRSSRIY
jgi:hypothetical protein